MTDLERRALLGDRKAQEECTSMGIVLPCPCCYSNAKVRYTGNGSAQSGYTSNVYCRSNPGFIMCNKCGTQTSKANRACRALAKWNTRPVPPLGWCASCAYWDENTCECKSAADIDVAYHKYTEPNFFCGDYESKCGEENG